MSGDMSGDTNPPIDDPADEAMFAELGDVIREFAGAPPPASIAAAKEVFTWRTIDAELALLTFDSLVDEPANAVRSGNDVPRVLTFEAGSTVVDAELSVVDGTRRLMGHLSPARVAELELTTESDRLMASVDARGRFSVDLPHATTRIGMHIHFDDGTSIWTAATAI